MLGVAAAEVVGVGMVRWFGPQSVSDLVVMGHPQVVVGSVVPKDSEGFLSTKVSAWALGSGVSSNDELQVDNVNAVISNAVTAVVDAGALEVIDFSNAQQSDLLLTPHTGEASRLWQRLGLAGNPDFESQEGLQHVASTLAKATGQTVLLKGSVTVIATEVGQLVAVGPNSPHLAAAGTGDVLAGMLAGIAAQNAGSRWPGGLTVAQLAVTMHSRAAQLAAAKGAVTASKVLAALPEVYLEVVHSD